MAGAVMWALDQPEHVDVGEVLILPTAQGVIPPKSEANSGVSPVRGLSHLRR